MKFEEFVKNHRYRYSNIGNVTKKAMPKRSEGFNAFEKWFCVEFNINPL